MKFSVISVFPELIEDFFKVGVVGIALRNQILSLDSINPRDFASDKHRSVDDAPFGGGEGMVMMVEPLTKSVRKVKSTYPQTKVIHFSPKGRILNEALVTELSRQDHLTLICSRYSGVDQRFIDKSVDLEISLGDFVISGGEAAAICLIDAIARKVPGVLGNQESANLDSFSVSLHGLLEEPIYTRPQSFEGLDVPSVLLSGNHAEISKWKQSMSLLMTLKNRPDLLSDLQKQKALEILKKGEANESSS